MIYGSSLKNKPRHKQDKENKAADDGNLGPPRLFTAPFSPGRRKLRRTDSAPFGYGRLRGRMTKICFNQFFSVQSQKTCIGPDEALYENRTGYAVVVIRFQGRQILRLDVNRGGNFRQCPSLRFPLALQNFTY